MIGRIGIDSYGLHPRHLPPIDVLRWAKAHGAGGVQFSGFAPDEQAALDAGQLREIGRFARDRGLYIEWSGAQHIPRDTSSWARKDLVAHNHAIATQALLVGARVIRSCSGGLMRWTTEAPPTDELLDDTVRSLQAQQTMLTDLGVVLAIETHFEFTSFELIRILERAGAEPGGWLGICLDTMNLLTMLEEPVAATRRLLPWVVATHLKDGGVLASRDGLATFPVGIGDGVIDLRGILALVDSLASPVHLTIEDHGGSFALPIHDEGFLSRFPDLAPGELSALLHLAETARSRSLCRPIGRDEWPAICEDRLSRDLAAARRLVDTVRAGPPVRPGGARP